VIGVVLALFYFILAGYVPAAYIESNYTHGTLYVNLYSHVFRYSQFFGWLTILLLIPPVSYLKLRTNIKPAKHRLLLFSLIFILSLVLLTLAFNSANVAPFGVKRQLAQSEPALKDHFAKPAPTEVERREYQKRMLELHSDRTNWSAARYLYYLAVFIQIFTMLFILFAGVALCVHRGLSPHAAQSYKFKAALLYYSLAILVAYLWLLMRFAFVEQKTKYFPGVYNFAGDFWIAAVFVGFSVIFVTVQFSSVFGKYTFLLNLIPLSFGIFAPLSFGSTLVLMFGKDVDVFTYRSTLAVILIVLIIPFVLVFMLDKRQKGKKPQSPPVPPSP
jgi:hypothetical protein